MNEDVIKEIRIAKTQIMYSVFIAVFALGLFLEVFSNPLNFLFLFLFIGLWFWGIVYLRKEIESEKEIVKE